MESDAIETGVFFTQAGLDRIQSRADDENALQTATRKEVVWELVGVEIDKEFKADVKKRNNG